MKHALALAIASLTICFPAIGQRSAAVDEVMKVEEQYRVAKLHQDTRAMSLILADNFLETNQNGNTRTKAQTIELWTSFSIDSLVTDSADVKITGDTAVVSGTQTEHNASGVDRMLFMRVYVRAGSTWQLLACSQFRDPRSSAM